MIAVLDDEPEMRKALGRLLLAHGFEVGLHAAGEELLASLASRAPDCVVLDLHMPGVSGLDLLAAIPSRYPRIPIIVITGHDEPDTADQVRRRGPAAYLTKPVDETTLCAAIEAAMRDSAQLPTTDVPTSGPSSPEIP